MVYVSNKNIKICKEMTQKQIQEGRKGWNLGEARRNLNITTKFLSLKSISVHLHLHLKQYDKMSSLVHERLCVSSVCMIYCMFFKRRE